MLVCGIDKSKTGLSGVLGFSTRSKTGGMSLTSRPCERLTTAMKRTDPTSARPYGRAYSRSRRRSFIDRKLSRVRLFQACASRVRLFKDAQAFECGNDARDAHLGETFRSD